MNISMPSNIVTDLMSANSATFTSLLPLLAVLVGVPMVFYVIRKIAFLFPKV